MANSASPGAAPHQISPIAATLASATDHVFARGLGSGLGLSFSTAGLGPAATLARFRVAHDERRIADGRPRREVTLVDSERGLRATLEYELYPERRAIVIGMTLTNEGIAPVPHLTDIRSLDLTIDLSAIGHPRVHTVGGGVTHWMFPPEAFQLDARQISGAISVARAYRIDSGGTGRSSDKNLPFFYVESEDEQSGLYGGLEWSGLWNADFFRQGNYLGIRMGIEELDLTLRPGESIVAPRALLGFYDGSLRDGQNALRRFISSWYPLLDGQEFGPPVFWNHYFTFNCNFNEDLLRRQVDVCSELGIEYFQVDAGWYTGCRPELGGPGFSYGVGNWDQVDPAKFPNGIRPFADYVRSKGMKYATWFDPERVHPSSLLARQHPDWICYVDLPDVLLGRPQGQEWGLVDFGRVDVQDYFINLLQRRIDEFGIEWLKWDNNINPRTYWNAYDAPGHRGLQQLRHIRGVYRVWDAMRHANPSMVFENCSSGGRRLDLGTFSRAHVHFSSDFNHDSDIVRNQLSGANTVIPSHRLISTCTQGPEDSPNTYFHSRFGGLLRFSQDFASWSRPALARAKQHIDVYKSIRHCLRGDFYALFGQPISFNAWDGWQFHNPDGGDGFALVFRLSSEAGTQRPRLFGLVPDARYVLTDPYTGAESSVIGRSLLDDGLSVELARNGSRLLQYRPA